MADEAEIPTTGLGPLTASIAFGTALIVGIILYCGPLRRLLIRWHASCHGDTSKKSARSTPSHSNHHNSLSTTSTLSFTMSQGGISDNATLSNMECILPIYSSPVPKYSGALHISWYDRGTQVSSVTSLPQCHTTPPEHNHPVPAHCLSYQQAGLICPARHHYSYPSAIHHY